MAQVIEDFATSLRRWFDETKLASVILPEGQLGAPGDLWPLTRANVWGHRLLIELDERVLLLVLRPSELALPAGKLIISGFSRLTVEHEAIGGGQSRTLIFENGSLEFWGRDRQQHAWAEHRAPS